MTRKFTKACRPLATRHCAFVWIRMMKEKNENYLDGRNEFLTVVAGYRITDHKRDDIRPRRAVNIRNQQNKKCEGVLLES
jgi:hypothetical protein